MAYKPTIFSQVLQTVPGLRLEFQRIVDQYGGDRRVRTLNCWTQLGGMLYEQPESFNAPGDDSNQAIHIK